MVKRKNSASKLLILLFFMMALRLGQSAVAACTGQKDSDGDFDGTICIDLTAFCTTGYMSDDFDRNKNCMACTLGYVKDSITKECKLC